MTLTLLDRYTILRIDEDTEELKEQMSVAFDGLEDAVSYYKRTVGAALLRSRRLVFLEKNGKVYTALIGDGEEEKVIVGKTTVVQKYTNYDIEKREYHGDVDSVIVGRDAVSRKDAYPLAEDIRTAVASPSNDLSNAITVVATCRSCRYCDRDSVIYVNGEKYCQEHAEQLADELEDWVMQHPEMVLGELL